MPDRDDVDVNDDTTSAAAADTHSDAQAKMAAQAYLRHLQALAEKAAEGIPESMASKVAMHVSIDLANGEITKNNDAKREIVNALLKRFLQAGQSKIETELDPDLDEIGARTLLDSFDGRITEVEQRIDRVLARLDAG